MAKLITVFWRDIPVQIIAKRGRDRVKVRLSARFREAVDRAAMRAGKGSSNAYLGEWRRKPRECSSDLSAEAQAEAALLEAGYSDDQLARLIKSGGARQS